MNFSLLIQTIQQTHTALQQQAAKAINRALTLRNWLIGYYIVEFEQNGDDRAKYGERLVDELADKLQIKGLSGRNLKLMRQFYLAYPQIMQTVSALSGVEVASIRQTVSAKLQLLDFQINSISGPPSQESAQNTAKKIHYRFRRKSC